MIVQVLGTVLLNSDDYIDLCYADGKFAFFITSDHLEQKWPGSWIKARRKLSQKCTDTYNNDVIED